MSGKNKKQNTFIVFLKLRLYGDMGIFTNYFLKTVDFNGSP